MFPTLNNLQELLNLTLTVRTDDRLSLFKNLVLGEVIADNFRSLLPPGEFLSISNEYNKKLDEMRTQISNFAKTIPTEKRKNILEETGRQLPSYFLT
ncbi:hypothetical protein GW755_01625 [bacterium]|nr:hypothetical protein [bacterium]